MENKIYASNPISSGDAFLGIEFGSTRIKAVLVNDAFVPLASGSFSWESTQTDGVWSYGMDEIRTGLQAAYADLAAQVKERYGVPLRTVKGICISGMMHGYIPLDEDFTPLVPFRTWRNTITGQAAEALTELFGFQIPQRWSVAHLYQAVLNGEAHLPKVRHLVTLAVYVHYLLTGELTVGLCEASGMFPVDPETKNYDVRMLKALDAKLEPYAFPWSVGELLPEIREPGTCAGRLTPTGAALLDVTGELQPDIPFTAPEGDAATGMLCTNSLQVRTGNVSSGTSFFATVILEKPWQRVHPAIDVLVSPTGRPAAMVHCNNGTNEINAWAYLFRAISKQFGASVDIGTLFDTLFRLALDGEPDCGGVVVYNTLAGEPVLGFDSAVPMTFRGSDSRFTAGNFMRAQLYACLAPLRLGMQLLEGEGVTVDKLIGHGGFFTTPDVGQSLMASALKTPICVRKNAGEGGAWGAALLAAYTGHTEVSLEDYVENNVFRSEPVTVREPNFADAAGFDAYLKAYTAGLNAVSSCASVAD